jgi:hypothetical protein
MDAAGNHSEWLIGSDSQVHDELSGLQAKLAEVSQRLPITELADLNRLAAGRAG